MSRSQRLRLCDVRAIFRLLGEVRELGDEPLVWRRHMLESLCRLLGGQAGISAEVLFQADAPEAVPESFAEYSISDRRGWEALVRFPLTPEARSCPVFCAMTRCQPGGHTINVGRGHIGLLFDERTWRGSALTQARLVAGLEGHIYSQQALPTGRAIHVISINRVTGEKIFTSVETRLVRLFHAELARIWRLPTSNGLPALSPRLRQTLDGLLVGDGEKQIAAQLGLSRHTVHNYAKELHRRFDVSSRGELLRRCAERTRRDFTPRLTTSFEELMGPRSDHAMQPQSLCGNGS